MTPTSKTPTGRLVPLDVRIEAKVELDDLLQPTEAEIAHLMAGGLSDLAASRAEDVTVEAVWIYRHDVDDGPPFRHQYYGRWAPPPGRPVELRGGIADGQIISLEHGRDGWPPPLFRVPVMQPTSLEEITPSSTISTTTADYRLAGFDPDSVRWVYVLG